MLATGPCRELPTYTEGCQAPADTPEKRKKRHPKNPATAREQRGKQRRKVAPANLTSGNSPGSTKHRKLEVLNLPRKETFKWNELVEKKRFSIFNFVCVRRQTESTVERLPHVRKHMCKLALRSAQLRAKHVAR